MKKVKNIIYTIYGFSIHPIINTYFCFSSALYLFGSAVLYTIATYVGNPGGDENLAYKAENNNNYGHISDNYVVLAAINEKREEIALAAINEENIAPIGYNSPHSIDDVYILVHKSAINKNIAQNTGPISNNVENAAKKKKIAINLNNIDKDKLVNNSLVPLFLLLLLRSLIKKKEKRLMKMSYTCKYHLKIEENNDENYIK